MKRFHSRIRILVVMMLDVLVGCSRLIVWLIFCHFEMFCMRTKMMLVAERC